MNAFMGKRASELAAPRCAHKAQARPRVQAVPLCRQRGPGDDQHQVPREGGPRCRRGSVYTIAGLLIHTAGLIRACIFGAVRVQRTYCCEAQTAAAMFSPDTGVDLSGSSGCHSIGLPSPRAPSSSWDGHRTTAQAC